MLRYKSPGFLKTSKTVLLTCKLSLISPDIFYKSKQKLNFQDQKGLRFLYSSFTSRGYFT